MDGVRRIRKSRARRSKAENVEAEIEVMIEVTLSMSDKDILAEVAETEGDPHRIADELRQHLLKGLTRNNN